MSVDYKGVGGIGIHWNKIRDRLVSAGITEKGEDEDSNVEQASKKLGTSYDWIGSCYSCTSAVLLIKGENLSEVNQNAKLLIEKFAEYGIQITESDFEVIAELYES